MIPFSPQTRAAVQRLTLPVLVIASVLLIILGKADEVTVRALRNAVADAAAPVLTAFSQPIVAGENLAERAGDLLALYRQNARLRAENARLLHWQQAALTLAAENAELRRLTRLVPAPMVSFVSARVIAGSGGSYVRSVLVDAGRQAGVARGQAALTGEGLVGRVTAVGARTARVLLITDLNSRVPVFVGRARQQAILAGDNAARPRLEYFARAAAIRPGERVVTSGQGGVFPPDVPVGIVASADGGGPRVEPFAALSRIEFLRIVDRGPIALPPEPAAGGAHARSRR